MFPRLFAIIFSKVSLSLAHTHTPSLSPLSHFCSIHIDSSFLSYTQLRDCISFY